MTAPAVPVPVLAAVGRDAAALDGSGRDAADGSAVQVVRAHLARGEEVLLQQRDAGERLGEAAGDEGLGGE